MSQVGCPPLSAAAGLDALTRLRYSVYMPLMTFPEVLRFDMKYLHLSSTDLAKKVDIDLSHVSRLLSGERDPSLELLSKLGDIFRWDATKKGEVMDMIARDKKKKTEVDAQKP